MPKAADKANHDRPEKPPRHITPTRLVRYGAMGWVGEFSHKPALNPASDASVVIQSDRGIELGACVGGACGGCGAPTTEQVRCYVQASGPDFCQPRAGRIMRVATEQDVNEQRHLDAHIGEYITQCANLAGQMELDLKVVTAEHLLGGERIVFYFRSPGRVDFRQLVRELAQHHRTRIEMRQVGARDEARLVADYEICGRECCCKNFLKKLRPVNMKMAKLQKSTLDPSKVSGRCGRLRCCLRYEHIGYEELLKRLPRPNSRVDTEFGPATVLDRQVLTQLVAVRTDSDRLVTIPLEEIKAFNLPPAPPRPEKPADGPRRKSAAAPGDDSRRGRGRSRGRPGGAERRSEPETESRFHPQTPDSSPRSRPKPVKPNAPPDKPARRDSGASAADTVRPPSPPKADGKPDSPEQAPGRKRRRRRRRRPSRGDAGPSAGPSSK